MSHHIKNIACCFYGSFRHSEDTIKHIETQLDSLRKAGFNVDSFCSFKMSPEERENLHILNDIIHPRDVSIIDVESSNDFKNTKSSHDYLVNRIDTLIKSLFIKQKFELENDSFYDAVIVLRPDALTVDFNAYEILLRFISNLFTDKYRRLHSCQDGDGLFCFKYSPELVNSKTEMYPLSWYLFPDNINDMFLIGTGTALDRICLDLMASIATQTSILSDIDECRYPGFIEDGDWSHGDWSHFSSLHTIISHTANKIAVATCYLSTPTEGRSDELFVISEIGLLKNNQSIPIRNAHDLKEFIRHNWKINE